MTAKTKLADEVEDAAKTVQVAAEKEATRVLDAGQATIEQVAQHAETVAAAGTRGVDVLMQGASAAAQCIQAINAETLSYTRQAVEDGVAAAQALMGIRSVREMVDIQGQYSRAAFDRFVNYSTTLNDLLLSAGKDVFRPLSGELFDLRRAA